MELFFKTGTFYLLFFGTFELLFTFAEEAQSFAKEKGV
jgi:hypothetical protein